MAADEDRRREIKQLRAEIEALRDRLAAALDRGASRRDVVLAIAREMRERQDRLEEIEGFPRRE